VEFINYKCVFLYWFFHLIFKMFGAWLPCMQGSRSQWMYIFHNFIIYILADGWSIYLFFKLYHNFIFIIVVLLLFYLFVYIFSCNLAHLLYFATIWIQGVLLLLPIASSRVRSCLEPSNRWLSLGDMKGLILF
jgi:hypothetical protein